MAYTSSGFQFSDTAATVLTGSLARAAGETVLGSPYAITQGTLAADSNYTIHFTGSTLTHHPGDARGDRQRPGRDLHRRADRGHGHRDGRRRHGSPRAWKASRRP